MNQLLRKLKLYGIGLFVAHIVLVSFALGQATVTTDKLDYYPGDTVIVTGSGWQPGETVQLHFDETPQVCNNDHNRYAVADSNGNIYNNQFLINWHHLGVSFVLTATGQSSGLSAVTYFVDAPRISSVSVNPLSRTVCDPQGSEITTATYTVTSSRGGNGTVNGSYTVLGLPTGVTATGLSSFTSNGGSGFPSSTLTLSVSSAASPGTYGLWVRLADNADSAGAPCVLVIQEIPSAPIVATQNFCNTSSATVANLPQGGSTYKWYADATGGTALAGTATLSSGTTYYVSETSGGCESARTAVLVQLSNIGLSISTQTHVSCFGGSDGVVTISATGGIAPYEYKLDAGTYGNSASFTGLAAGNYVVTVKDAAGCEKTINVQVTEPSVISGSTSKKSYNGSDLSCNNSADGEITVSASGGTGALVYSNDNGANYQAGNVFNNLAAGNYIIKVKDANNCEVTIGTVTISAPPVISGSGSVTSNYNGSQLSCHNSTDGVITVTASGGTGTLQYSIDGGGYQLSNVFSNLGAGLHTLSVKDANGCTVALTSVTITAPAIISGSGSVTSNYNGSQLSCHNSTDGVITVTASGGTGTLQYSIDGGGYQASNVFSGLAAGLHTLSVKDANGCTVALTSVTITAPTIISGSGSVTSNYNGSQLSCHNSTDGVITVTASGGTGTLQYSIDGGGYQLSNVFSGLGAGLHTLSVKDANGCTVSLTSVTITAPVIISGSGTVTSNYNGSQLSCHNSTDGVITVTASGGTGTLQYSIDGGGYQLSNVFSNLGAGLHTLSVKDANGCIVALTSVTITAPAIISGSGSVTSNNNGSQLSCHNSTDGVITITASGGTGTLQYSIDGGGYQGSNVFSGLAAGLHTLSVKDANGCIVALTSVTITAPTIISGSGSVTSNYNGSQLSCHNSTDGVITVTASGGTGTLQYSIDGGGYQLSNVFSGLAAGLHTLSVKDANGCTVSLTSVTITAPTIISGSGSVTSNYNGSQLSCHNSTDGVITVTASGGTGTLQYSIDGGGYQGSNVFSSLAAGLHTLSVKDANGCIVALTSVTITAPLAITGTATKKSYNGSDLSCNNSTDGEITVSASGGTGTKMYSNDNGANYQLSNVFSGLGAGSYIIKVKDANNCVATIGTVTITAPPVIVLTTSQTNVSCFGGNNGSVNLSVSGGTPMGVTPVVLDALPTQTFNSLASSGTSSTVPSGWAFSESGINANTTYTAGTGSSATGDTYSFGATGNSERAFGGLLSGNLTPFVAFSYTNNTGQTIDRINISYYGEQWRLGTSGRGADRLDFQYSTDATSLTTGTWVDVNALDFSSPVTVGTVGALDGNSNRVLISGSITGLSIPNGGKVWIGWKDFDVTNADDGLAIDDVTIEFVKTPAAYTYSWSNGATTEDIANLSQGSYTVTVTDVNGCSKQTTVTITQPPVISGSTSKKSYNSSDISCNGVSDGEITVTASGGTGTLQYSKDNGLNYQASNVFSALAAGSYTVKVKDANDCVVTIGTVTITAPPAITGNGAVTSNYNGSQLSCNTSTDGVITVTASGGTGTLQYSIDGGGYQASNVFSNLGAGLHTLSVKDANGCQKSLTSVTITAPAAITGAATKKSYNGSDLSCYNSTDGEITVSATGGTGVLHYSKDNGANYQAGNIFTGLAAGSYIIKVKDVNNCIAVLGTVTIVAPAELVLTSSQVDVNCNGGNNGSVNLSVTGGTANAKVSFNQDFNTLASTGTSTVIPLGWAFSESGTNANTTYTAGTGSGTAGDTYSFGATGNSERAFGGLQSGSLTPFIGFSYTNTTGQTIDRINISYYGEQWRLGDNARFDRLDFQYSLNATALSNGTWIDHNALDFIAPIGTGGTVGALDGNANRVLISGSIIGLSIPAGSTVWIGWRDFNASGSDDGLAIDDVAIEFVRGTTPYTYSWSNGATTEDVSNLTAGDYTVTVTDANGCSKQKTITINQPLLITGSGTVTSNYNGSQLSCHNSTDGVITVTASGGTGTLQYSIDGGGYQLSNVFSNLAAGLHTLSVKDANGCTVALTSVTITAPLIISGSGAVTSNYNGSQLSCHNSTDGVITVTASGGTGTLQYSIDGGGYQLSNVFSNLGAGLHTLSVKDANGCIVALTSVTITAPTIISGSGSVTSNYNGSQLSCHNSTDGVITVTASGGTGTLQYSIDGGGYQLSNVFSGLAAGLHTLSVKDANGCTVSLTSVTISAPAIISGSGSVTSNYNGSQLSCHNSTDGVITVTASGGTGTLQYSIDGGGYQLSNVFSNLAAGLHTLSVKDANGCTVSLTSVTITAPTIISGSGAVTSNYNGSQLSCHNSTDGVITVTASGGTGTLQYSIDGGGYQLSNVFSGLAAGLHTLSVKDANGCTVALTSVTITAPTIISGSGSVTSNYNGSQLSCHNSTDGVITVTASGGTGTLQYSIDGGGYQLSNVFSGLAAGLHTLSVKDANGCTVSLTSVTITAPPAIQLTSALVTSNYNGSQISCNGSTDGVITVVATGGTGSKVYTLSGGTLGVPVNNTTGVFTGLGAGVYNYSIADANSCGPVTGSVTITAPPAIQLTSALVTSNYNGSQISCNGSTDGVITVVSSGGTGTKVYSLSGGTLLSPVNNTTGVFTGLGAGVYNYSITDANSCGPVTGSVTITAPPAITGNGAVTSNYNGSQLSCHNTSDGAITVTASGGTGTLQYKIDNGIYQLSNVFTGLGAGIHTLSVKDANGCVFAPASVTITAPPALTVSASYNPVVYVGSSLNLSGTISGGTGAYTMSWTTTSSNGFTSNLEDPVVTTSATLADAGTYTLYVNDANECTNQNSVVVSINKRNTSLLYTGDLNIQYSDSVKLSATLSDVSGATPAVSLAGRTINFTIGSQSVSAVTNAAGVAATGMVITQAPGNYNVVTTFNGTADAVYNGSGDTDAFIIKKEDAIVDYIGNEIVATISTSNLTANIDLRVSVQDINDAFRGDIKNATVRFVFDNATVLEWTPVSTLVDPFTGVISKAVTKTLSGTSTSEIFELKVYVNNYYCASVLTVPITVYVPTGDFITGGGHIKPTNSAGRLPSDAASKTNFGFNVKYNKKGTSLQGKLNFVWRSGGKVYQAKSTAMDALGVDVSNAGAKKASFTSKCTVTDITDPDNPITTGTNLGGNRIMQVTMTDRGEPGINNDDIGFTLWEGNILVYSSHWTGSSTINKLLAGGNLVVHSGFSVGTTTTTTNNLITKTEAPATDEPAAVKPGIVLKARPNPTEQFFTLQVQSDKNETVQVRVTDMFGKQVYATRGSVYNTYRFGQNFVSGTYLVEVIQGDQRKTIQLIKQ